jgi:3-deoxy-manno-octulosonate cytidylyltransferase (CMP-KDO synthetase)
MASSRYPGKPLADIHGVPMVGHVAYRVKMCSMVSSTYIATCDQSIMEYAKANGLEAIMTKDTHNRCTDRAAEALLKIEETTGKKVDIVLVIQGDEPMITPDMVSSALSPMLDDPSVNVVNLMEEIRTVEEFEDPNEVKVVVDQNSDAVYFSREPVPSRRKGVLEVPMRKQVCIMPFRRDYLLYFNSLQETPLEVIESIDMLRILEHGEKVRMVPVTQETFSVDTPDDHKKVCAAMVNDSLRIQYSS